MGIQVPRLLISVRNEAEACDALSGGADVIDVKEPARGALGAADIGTVEKIISVVAGRRPVSVALGELGQWVDGGSGALPCGVEYAKVGLARAGQGWQDGLAACFDELSPVAPIAVAYADDERAGSPPVEQVLGWAIGYGAAGLLIDTAVKGRGGLFDWLSQRDLSRVIAQGREAGMMIALAGSLAGQQLIDAIEMGPDIVAVRGAACVLGDRQGRVDPGRVRDLARAFSELSCGIRSEPRALEHLA